MLKRVLVLTAIFVLAALFLGTAAPQPTATAKSPYVSSLSNYSVGTAVAASAKCNTGCLVLQGIQSCRAGESPGSKCTMVNGSCSLTTCNH